MFLDDQHTCFWLSTIDRKPIYNLYNRLYSHVIMNFDGQQSVISLNISDQHINNLSFFQPTSIISDITNDKHEHQWSTSINHVILTHRRITASVIPWVQRGIFARPGRAICAGPPLDFSFKDLLGARCQTPGIIPRFFGRYTMTILGWLYSWYIGNMLIGIFI